MNTIVFVELAEDTSGGISQHEDEEENDLIESYDVVWIIF